MTAPISFPFCKIGDPLTTVVNRRQHFLLNYTEAKANLVSVNIQSMPSSPEPEVGDTAETTYNGSMIEEALPSPNGVEKIVVINDAE